MSEDKKTLKDVIKQHREREQATGKTQNWEDIIDDELKIRHIMEDVLGWECFGSWKSYLRKYGAQEWELGAGKSYATHTPVAFYSGWEWRVFSADHEDLRRPFDPLHTMTDAWLVLQKIASFPDEHEGARDVKQSFFNLLRSLPNEPVTMTSLDLSVLAKWTPELICIAAWIAVQSCGFPMSTVSQKSAQ